MYEILLLLHLLAATIWTGGHIVLSTVVLPRVLKERSAEQLLKFETAYEKIGMPALIIQIITGLLMAYRILPDLTQWLDLSNPVSRILLVKIALLAITFGFALDAKLRVIPCLSEKNLVVMAWHIVPVTIISILFVIAGLSFRTGWLG
ncbi:MAG: CopD family protein [Porticoccaceae bacterium]|nr:CopD family protein [Pseudomonadales bacterium]MCP5171824.1 CopD family protein [Pseudomonadales bacterium]